MSEGQKTCLPGVGGPRWTLEGKRKGKNWGCIKWGMVGGRQSVFFELGGYLYKAPQKQGGGGAPGRKERTNDC